MDIYSELARSVHWPLHSREPHSERFLPSAPQLSFNYQIHDNIAPQRHPISQSSHIDSEAFYPPVCPPPPAFRAADHRETPAAKTSAITSTANNLWNCTLCSRIISGTFTIIGDHVMGRRHQTASCEAGLWQASPRSSVILTLPSMDRRRCTTAVSHLFQHIWQLGGALCDVWQIGGAETQAATGRIRLLAVCSEPRIANELVNSPPLLDERPVQVDRLPREFFSKAGRKRPRQRAQKGRPDEDVDHAKGVVACSAEDWRQVVPDQLREFHATSPSIVHSMLWLKKRLLLSPEESADRMRACQDISGYINEKLAKDGMDCTVHPFGSCVSGLGFHGCDLDLFVDVADSGGDVTVSHDKAAKTAVMIGNWMRRAPLPMCGEVKIIPRARVPVVKLIFRPLNMGCDLTFSNHLACFNSLWLFELLQFEERAQLVAVCIRAWAQMWSLSGGRDANKTLSSYCLALLAVFYLQQLTAPVLPSVECLQRLCRPKYVSDWNVVYDFSSVGPSANKLPTDVLLYGFFTFYAHLDFSSCVISPFLGSPVPREVFSPSSSDTAPAALHASYSQLVADGRVRPLDTDKPLVVQDPFELNFNVARSCTVNVLARFQQACRLAAQCHFVDLFAKRSVNVKIPPAPKRVLSSEDASDAGGKKVCITPLMNPMVQPKTSSAVSSERPPKSQTNGNQSATPVMPDITCKTKIKVEPSDSKASASQNSSLASIDIKSDIKKEVPDIDVNNKSKTAPVVKKSGRGAVNGKKKGRRADLKAFKELEMPPLSRCVLESATPSDVSSLLANMGSPPTSSVSTQLKRGISINSPHSVVMAAGRSVAEMIARVLSDVLLVSCRAVTFSDSSGAPSDVIAGLQCSVRRKLWLSRRPASAALLRLPDESRLLFERRVSQLLMSGGTRASPGQFSEGNVITNFWCYVLLDMDVRVVVNFHRDRTELAQKKNTANGFYEFIRSFVKTFLNSVDYVKEFPNALSTS